MTNKEKRLTYQEKTSVYNDLSRRGLIKLCNDFDKDNGNKLASYVNNKDTNYELTRIPEKVIDIGDGLIEVLEFAKETQTISKVHSLVTEVESMIKTKKPGVEIQSF